MELLAEGGFLGRIEEISGISEKLSVICRIVLIANLVAIFLELSQKEAKYKKQGDL